MTDPVFGQLTVNAVTVVRPASGIDRYGNTVPDWANATRTPAKGWLTRAATAETNQGREAVTSDYELSLPADVDIVDTDRVEVDGAPYRIIGSIDVAQTIAGPHHLIVRLKTVQG